MKTRLLRKLRREAENAYPIFPSIGYRLYIEIKYYRINYILNRVSMIRYKKNHKNNG